MSKQKLIMKGLGLLPALALLGFAATASADTYSSDQTYQNYQNSYESGNYFVNSSVGLTGNEEVPPVSSGVTGNINLSSVNDGETINYSLTITGPNITDAHLHCGQRGVNGPVVVGLLHNGSAQNMNNQTVSGTIGTVAGTGADCEEVIGYGIYDTEDLTKAINEGKIYANVHNTQFPSGAARGQIPMNSNGNNQSDNQNNNDGYNGYHDNNGNNYWGNMSDNYANGYNGGYGGGYNRGDCGDDEDSDDSSYDNSNYDSNYSQNSWRDDEDDSSWQDDSNDWSNQSNYWSRSDSNSYDMSYSNHHNDDDDEDDDEDLEWESSWEHVSYNDYNNDWSSQRGYDW